MLSCGDIIAATLALGVWEPLPLILWLLTVCNVRALCMFYEAKNRNMFGIPKSRILKNVLLPLFKSVVGNFFYLGYLISLLQSLNLATLLFSWWELYIYRSTFLVASNYRSGSVFCTYNVELFILFFLSSAGMENSSCHTSIHLSPPFQQQQRKCEENTSRKCDCFSISMPHFLQCKRTTNCSFIHWHA